MRSNILTENWKQIDFPSGDVTVVRLNGPWGELTIYNIYNDCDNNDTIHQLEALNHTQEADPRQGAANAKARHLARGLQQAPPALGQPSRHKAIHERSNKKRRNTDPRNSRSGTGPSPPSRNPNAHTQRHQEMDKTGPGIHLRGRARLCHHMRRPKRQQGVNTDHLPILTTLDLSLAHAPPTAPRNFRNVDWDEFNKSLQSKLDSITPPAQLHTQGELNEACNKLTSAIQEVIRNKIPTSDLGVKAKRWWTKELTQLRREANKKSRKASIYKGWPDHHTHAEHKEASKNYQRTMERTKRQHWRDWLEKAECYVPVSRDLGKRN
jgi:hypothetical protein